MPDPFTPARNIDEVIDHLQVIVDDSIREQTAYGIFAALYKVVTEKVREGIQRGDIFEDGPRMEILDVIFANRYFEAYHNYRAGQATTAPWQLAFESVDQFSRKIILQELLIGINAHVNFDLGIAAAEVAPGDAIDGLENDFNAINAILSSLIDGVKEDLIHLSPRFGWILRFFRGEEDAILDFSLRKARDEAWEFAEDLAKSSDRKDERLIRKRSRSIVRIGNLIVKPGLLGRLVVWWVKRKEVKDIAHILRDLSDNFQQRARFHVDD